MAEPYDVNGESSNRDGSAHEKGTARLPAGTIQSVVRALDILEFCSGRPGGSSARDVSAALGLTTSTASHLLGTLAFRGYLRKSGPRYQLAWKVAELGAGLTAGFRPPEDAIDIMNQLAAVTGETAYVSAWVDGDVMVLAVTEGKHPVRVSGMHIGMRGGAHSRASGKVLLAFGPPSRLPEYVASHRQLEAFTPATITSPKRLTDEVESARRNGYALDRSERLQGVECIAVPILGARPESTLAASVMAPESRFEDLMSRYLGDILAVSDRDE